jgi:hypothetical protein
MEAIAVLCACVLVVAYIGWLTRDRCYNCPARLRDEEVRISESAAYMADARVDDIVAGWAQLQAELSKDEAVVTPTETAREWGMDSQFGDEFSEVNSIYGD